MALKNRLTTGVSHPGPTTLPQAIALANYPNPFNPVTNVQYDLPHAGEIQLEVFNVLGERVAQLFDGYAAAGRHQVVFNGATLPTGVYFCRLRAQDLVKTIRLLLLR
jgi:hypothetical protein